MQISLSNRHANAISVHAKAKKKKNESSVNVIQTWKVFNAHVMS